jgi:hypothetical protein
LQPATAFGIVIDAVLLPWAAGIFDRYLYPLVGADGDLHAEMPAGKPRVAMGHGIRRQLSHA